MTSHRPLIHIGTVLLEKNRWTPDKRPSFKVSEWAPRFAAAGFDGIELWEPHASLAEPAEQSALLTMSLPVRILNSYTSFEAANKTGRAQAARLARRCGVKGMKINFGTDSGSIPEYVASLRSLQADLGPGVLLLCECHGGTVLEDPEAASRILAPFRDSIGIIVHAFSSPAEQLRRWFHFFGRSIAHVHAACHVPEVGFRKLSTCPDVVRERMAFLRDEGFQGSYTIEFTAGVARPPENMESLFSNAVADMECLRACL